MQTQAQRADVLGRLLVIQETLEAMPDDAKMAAFLDRALREVPGVAAVHLCVRGALYPPGERLKGVCARFAAAWEAPASIRPEELNALPGIVLLPLTSPRRLYGFLALSIDDPNTFAPYGAFLRSTANIVAIILERRDHIEQITRANDELARLTRDLEEGVAERTSELSQRNAELTEEIAERKRARQALQESEQKFRSLVETTSDWIWEVDEDGVYTFASPRVRDLLGYVPEEIVGRSAFDFMPQAEVERVRPIFEAASAARKPIALLENVNLRKDGREVVVESSGVPLFDGAGVFKGYRGIDRDITERRRSEEAVRKSEALLKLQIDRMPIGCVTWDTEFKVASWNPAAEKIFGFTAGEAMGKHPYDIIVPREAQPHVDAIWSRLLKGDTTARSVNENITKDGRTILCDWTNTPLIEADGKVVGVLAMVQDITERVQAEDALRRASLYTRSLIEASLDPLVTISAEGKITDVNEATIGATGVTRDRLVGSDFSDYFTEPERARAGYQEVFGKGFVKDYPLAIRHASGKVTDVLYNASLYRDEKGGAAGVFAAARDVTERKRAERALARTERALRTLSRGNEALVHATNEAQLLKDMCQAVVEVGGYAMAAISFAEHDEAKTVRPMAWAGREEGYLKAAQLTWADTERGHGPTGSAIRTGEPQVNQDIASNPVMAPWREAALKCGYASSMAAPLKGEGGVFGAMTLYAAEPDAFDGDELRLIVELAGDLSYGIDALRTRAERETNARQLQKSMEATIEALAGMIELRDPYTAGHQRNVSRLATAIAREMGLPEHDVEGIRLAGVVHDIGKIQVPAEILSKPGKLTALEFGLIKAHTQAGYDIVKGVDFPWPVATMVLQHHERMDGSGYPNGAKGEDVLVGSRILAVADVVEAMSSRRPYRAALGIDTALAEIEHGRGHLFDAAAVDACLTLFRSGRFTLD